MEQLTGKELQEKLTWKFPHIGQKAPEQVAEAAAFCEGYKEFLDRGKTVMWNLNLGNVISRGIRCT